MKHKGLPPQEAAQKIQEMTLQLLPENLRESLNENLLNFYVEKFVADCLAYCHIKKFPPPLIFDAAELISRQINEITAAAADDTSITTSSGALKKLKQDDTEFEWFETDLYSSLANKLFDALKPKLNLFRKLVAY